MTNPQDRVGILRREVADFKERLSALPPGAWGQPSACAGWTVAEVLGHLAGQGFCFCGCAGASPGIIRRRRAVRR